MKKRPIIFKSRVFFKYMFSYLAVLVLTLVLTGFFLYAYFLGEYQKQVVANLELQLEQTKNVLDDQIQRIDNMAKQIFTNPDIRLTNLATDPPQGMQVKSELLKYTLSDYLFYDMYFYPGQSNWLLSPYTSIDIDMFVERYPINGLDKEGFLAMLESVTDSKVLSAKAMDTSAENGGTSLITFIFSERNYSTQSKRKLVFFLNEAELQAVLPNEQSLLGDILIYDNNKQVISSILPQEDAARLLEQLPQNSDKPHHIVKVNNTEYLCMVRQSSQTQWIYLSLVLPDVAFAAIYRLRWIILLCFAVVLTVGSWLCWLCATRNYAPLGELKLFAEGGATADKGQGSDKNEFESVRNALSALRVRNITLTNQFERSSDAVREQLLYHLIKGEIATPQAFNEQGKFVQLQLPFAHFAVAVFYASYSAEIHFSELSHFGRSIEGLLTKDIVGYARAYNEPSRLTLAICCEKGDPQRLIAAVALCREHLAQATGVAVAVGISNICTVLTDFPRAYIQAQTALEYRFLRGEHSVLPFGEIDNNELRPDIELKNIPEKIDTIFRKGNIEGLNIFLTNIIAYLRESSIPLFSAKMICYDIINAISKNVDEQYYKFLTKGFERPNVFSVSSFETVDELLEVLIETNMSLACLLTDKDDSTLPSIIESMILYIRNYCYDCNFSINRMAEQFEMSASNLSQYFKSKTGDTIINFIAQVKLCKAKELLLNTNMPLQDIATEVGYYNVTSFIRRFKQQCGQTPGDFRRNV